jgi:hypothetical protein
MVIIVLYFLLSNLFLINAQSLDTPFHHKSTENTREPGTKAAILPPNCKRVERGGAAKPVAHGMLRNTYRVVVGKPEGKGPLGMPRCRWEDNIKMNFREIGWGGTDWFRLA